ncbi:MAG: hypothetical protein GY750_14260 [Lentisphaerae bacterium]|nr:hypothetical protein [Lentisphaerota bacterium]MCP4102564.1 hypothetical protein [Lentisphaerota bacterium]
MSNCPKYELFPANRFEAKMTGRGYLQIRELGIERTPSGSWDKIDPKDKIFSED